MPKGGYNALHPRRSVRSDYLGAALYGGTLKGLVNRSADVLSDYKFDALAFRGMSGALVAPMLAERLDKYLIMVRKDHDEESHHSDYSVEGITEAVNYIIVDDFISTGKTVRTIISKIYHSLNQESRCIGVLQYLRLDSEKEKFLLTDVDGPQRDGYIPVISEHTRRKWQYAPDYVPGTRTEYDNFVTALYPV